MGELAVGKRKVQKKNRFEDRPICFLGSVRSNLPYGATTQ